MVTHETFCGSANTVCVDTKIVRGSESIKTPALGGGMAEGTSIPKASSMLFTTNSC